MYVCSCFGITESQVEQHAAAGACTPRQIASQCKAGTDCGSCVRRIRSLLGRGGCARREQADTAAPAAPDEILRSAAQSTPAPLPAVASALQGAARAAPDTALRDVA